MYNKILLWATEHYKCPFTCMFWTNVLKIQQKWRWKHFVNGSEQMENLVTVSTQQEVLQTKITIKKKKKNHTLACPYHRNRLQYTKKNPKNFGQSMDMLAILFTDVISIHHLTGYWFCGKKAGTNFNQSNCEWIVFWISINIQDGKPFL